MAVLPAVVVSGSFYEMSCDWNISSVREADYQSFLNDTGCDDFSCLRTLDDDTMLNASVKYWPKFLPSIDGDFMTAHPVELFEQGVQIPVPLLMGGE